MKLAGAVIIILSSLMTGIYMTENIKAKIKICRELVDLANYILPEIKLKQTSAFDLFESSKFKNLDYVGQDMLIFEQSAKTPLSQEENRSIGSFFYSLGKYDVDNQIKQIEFFKEYMSSSLRKYEEMYKSKAKIYLSLGFSFGIVITLVLI